MKYLFVAFTLLLIMGMSGCDKFSPLDADFADLLVGSWSGVLDYTESIGGAVPMSLTFTKDSDDKLHALLTTAEAVYEDDLVTEANDNIVMNFTVAGETWELLLVGKLRSSSLEGNIIRREAGEDDIVLGVWAAVPS
jgi:hypothetical protein